MRAYLYVRKMGVNTTKIVEIDRKDAIQIMRQNRQTGYQLGILDGKDLNTITRVYREYAPFRQVATAEELIEDIKNEKLSKA